MLYLFLVVEMALGSAALLERPSQGDGVLVEKLVPYLPGWRALAARKRQTSHALHDVLPSVAPHSARIPRKKAAVHEKMSLDSKVEELEIRFVLVVHKRLLNIAPQN